MQIVGVMKDAKIATMWETPCCPSTKDKQENIQEKKCHTNVQKKTYTHQTIEELKQDMNEKAKEKVGWKEKRFFETIKLFIECSY